jgi:hypothetical protein
MPLFEDLGFHWDRSQEPAFVPVHSVQRACVRFKQMLPEFVWDAGVAEGNPFTYPEVKTLMDGITVGGRRVADQEQILNLADSCKYLFELVRAGDFSLSRQVFCALHALVARNEALEWGHFRGEGAEGEFWPKVALGERGSYAPPATEPGGRNLIRIFERGIAALEADVLTPFERARALFLFGALQQFFFDGNKRTSRLMMNGVLMSAGIDAISIPAARVLDFNAAMVRFYESKDGTEMMDFLVECHPEVDAIRQAQGRGWKDSSMTMR